MRDPTRYDTVAIALHWITAVAVIGQIALGLTMANAPRGSHLQFDLVQLHKSIGITILALSLLRLGWRIGHPPPPLPATMTAGERRLALATHHAFYVFLIGLPLTGWLVVSASRLAIPTRLYWLVPLPHLPVPADPAAKAGLHEIAESIHNAGAYVMAGLVLVHVAAASFHHLKRKDDVLRRMLPFMLAAVMAPLVATPASSATSWTVDPARSSLGFSGTQSGVRFDGHFTRWRSDIVFDPANPQAGHAHIVIDMASATTGDREMDDQLPASDWLDVKAFPQAVFDAGRFVALGDNRFEADGTLTIRGIAKTVALPFTLDIADGKAHAVGKLPLVRTDYGVGQGAWADGNLVALGVTVSVDIVAAAP